MAETFNTNVTSETVLISPEDLRKKLPTSAEADKFVYESRQVIQNILDGKDHRLLVIVGPCSIHDVELAKEYAKRLKLLHEQLKDTLYIVMRVYYEKPRTSIGWKGLINDPDLDDSCDIQKGLAKARELGVWLAEYGLPAGTEALDPITPQYLSELFAWAAIGARTTESQTHREMASGLSMPVGFKNGTGGGVKMAVNAIQSAQASHKFIGMNVDGQVTIIQTGGNRFGHVILRGGKQPNYDSVNVKLCEDALVEGKVPSNIVVDCSHANSYKKFELQPLVADNIAQQILNGNTSIMGIMLESHLNEGKQSFPAADKIDQIKHGVSLTDGCISWESTDILLRNLSDKLKDVLKTRAAARQFSE
ncbi:MAG: 3-deoxy-7-phosphoheptulonate synthase [Anaerolineae bacterium]